MPNRISTIIHKSASKFNYTLRLENSNLIQAYPCLTGIYISFFLYLIKNDIPKSKMDDISIHYLLKENKYIINDEIEDLIESLDEELFTNTLKLVSKYFFINNRVKETCKIELNVIINLNNSIFQKSKYKKISDNIYSLKLSNLCQIVGEKFTLETDKLKNSLKEENITLSEIEKNKIDKSGVKGETLKSKYTFNSFTSESESPITLNKIHDGLLYELSIFGVAKYLTTETKEDLTGLDDILRIEVGINELIAAISYLPEAVEILSKELACDGSQIIYPDSVIELSTICHNFIELNKDEYNADGQETSVYKHIKNNTSKVVFTKPLHTIFVKHLNNGAFSLSRFIHELILSEGASIEFLNITKLRMLNPICNRGLVKFKQVSVMKNKLTELVKGQLDAIDALCTSWMMSETIHGTGPRLIATFCGSSGVGKSLLARSFTNEINNVEGSDYIFKEFSMSQFINEKDNSILFGAGSFYADQPLGEITSFVRSYPRCVLLFDEIEKAHPSVIKSFLALLDTGKEKDRTGDFISDFSQCIVIFTTNVGLKELSTNTSKHDINVFDLLRSVNIDSNHSHKLPPELINRLSKGVATIFKELELIHFSNVIKYKLDEKTKLPSNTKINWPIDFEFTILQLAAPEFAIRNIDTVINNISSNFIEIIIDDINENNTDIIIDLEVENKLDRETITPIIYHLGNYHVSHNEEFKVTSFTSYKDLTATLLDTPPSILILNLDIMMADNAHVIPILDELINSKGNMSCYTYSKQPLSISLTRFLHSHAAFRPHSYFDEVSKEDITHLITVAQTELNNESFVKTLKRLNQKVVYHCENISDKNGLKIKLVLDNIKQSIYASDLNNKLWQRESPTEKLTDVVGLERAKSRIIDVIDFMKKPEFFNSLGVTPPTGYLLTGKPGTGKTLLAKALAGECKLPFFSVSSGDLLSGNPSQNIKDLYAMARKYAPSIVFIDEIETLGLSRKNGGNAITVNSLLTEMDGFESKGLPIFTLAATNHADVLDDALTRPGRFDEIIICDHPNYKARFTLLKMKFINDDISEEIIKKVAEETLSFSAAELDQLYREVKYVWRVKERNIDYELIHEKIVHIRYGAVSESLIITPEMKKETAYHEAGHLIVSQILQPDILIDYVTIEPRDRALGFVAFRNKDSYQSLSRERIKHQLAVNMAGRAGEHILYNDSNLVSTGAHNDILNATALAKYAIYEAGLSEEFSPVNIDKLAQLDSKLILKAEAEVLSWLEEASALALDTLTKNKSMFELFAKELYTKESMVRADIESYFK